MINKILIATGNPAKLNYYKTALKDLPLDVISLKDLNITQDFEENEKTFEGNAIGKAEFFCKLSGLPTLTDDGGLEIDALQGEPGVRSRRWPGYEATDEEMIQLAIDKLKGVPTDKRGAQLRSVTALKIPDREVITLERRIRGRISEKPNDERIDGFPFRSVFIIEKFEKFYNELTPEESKQDDHRNKVMEKLKLIIKELGVHE